MNTGSAPTDRQARTGEFTPPGMIALARSKISWLRFVVMGPERSPETAGAPPAARRSDGGLARFRIVGAFVGRVVLGDILALVLVELFLHAIVGHGVGVLDRLDRRALGDPRFLARIGEPL